MTSRKYPNTLIVLDLEAVDARRVRFSLASIAGRSERPCLRSARSPQLVELGARPHLSASSPPSVELQREAHLRAASPEMSAATILDMIRQRIQLGNDRRQEPAVSRRANSPRKGFERASKEQLQVSGVGRCLAADLAVLSRSRSATALSRRSRNSLAEGGILREQLLDRAQTALVNRGNQRPGGNEPSIPAAAGDPIGVATVRSSKPEQGALSAGARPNQARDELQVPASRLVENHVPTSTGVGLLSARTCRRSTAEPWSRGVGDDSTRCIDAHGHLPCRPKPRRLGGTEHIAEGLAGGIGLEPNRIGTHASLSKPWVTVRLSWGGHRRSRDRTRPPARAPPCEPRGLTSARAASRSATSVIRRNSPVLRRLGMQDPHAASARQQRPPGSWPRRASMDSPAPVGSCLA